MCICTYHIFIMDISDSGDGPSFNLDINMVGQFNGGFNQDQHMVAGGMAFNDANQDQDVVVGIGPDDSILLAILILAAIYHLTESIIYTGVTVLTPQWLMPLWASE